MANINLRDDWKPGHFEAHVTDKRGHVIFQSGLHPSRIGAALEAFQAVPRADRVRTGRGWQGCSAIEWMPRSAALESVQ